MENFPKSIRIIAIIQLCLAFTLISWHMGYPFMGKLFAVQSKKQLVQTVMGTYQAESTEKMIRNKARYENLPVNHQLTLQRYLDELNHIAKYSFWKKFTRAIHLLAFEISPIEQMWIVFAILVPLLFLLNSDGAKQAAFLLPLIVVCYALDNHWNGYEKLSIEETLFPSEKQIVNQYLKQPLPKGIGRQKEQLLLGWQLYLIENWAHEAPSDDREIRISQIEEGEHRFQTARVLSQASQPPKAELFAFRRKQPTPILVIYLAWNLFFAWFVNKRRAASLAHHPQ